MLMPYDMIYTVTSGKTEIENIIVQTTQVETLIYLSNIIW